MDISIIIPHYKVWKVTAYCIHKILKHKGNHNVRIIVVDNCAGDGSGDKLQEMYGGDITLLPYPADLLQSHGIATDYAMNVVNTEWCLAMESDSYPERDGFLDYYQDLIDAGCDSAGSLLDLSGGNFIHACGLLFRKSIWWEAMQYANKIQYKYFLNCAMKDGFPCHLMVGNAIVLDFITNPTKYVELSDEYKDKDADFFYSKAAHYLPVCGVFHNGMGSNQESYYTYGQRTIDTEPKFIHVEAADGIIFRMGYEPGQWFCYYQIAMGKKVFAIPTETKWMPGRVNQQQEYTKMENGLTHSWGLTSYADYENVDMRDVITHKRAQVEELYNSITNH